MARTNERASALAVAAVQFIRICGDLWPKDIRMEHTYIYIK